MTVSAPLSQGWVCRRGIDVDLRLATCSEDAAMEGMVRGARVSEAEGRGTGPESPTALWCNTSDDPDVIVADCQSIAEDTGWGFDISIRRGDGFLLPSVYARVRVFDVMVNEAVPCVAVMMDRATVRRIRDCDDD